MSHFLFNFNSKLDRKKTVCVEDTARSGSGMARLRSLFCCFGRGGGNDHNREKDGDGETSSYHRAAGRNSKDLVQGELLAEKERVEELRALIDGDSPGHALGELLGDTDNDLHYFNKLRSQVDPVGQRDAFERRHGKLIDFEQRPKEVPKANQCMWVETRGSTIWRCHNPCLFHPIQRVKGHLGAEHPKQMKFCIYHVKHCVQTDRHAIDVRILTPNRHGLCNECHCIRFGAPPAMLERVPGTGRKR